MAKGMRVSGVAQGARRTDLDNAQRVMREAKIQEATGGPRGQRQELTALASEGIETPTASAVSANPFASFQTVGAFDETTMPERAMTYGVDYGADEGSSALGIPVDSIDDQGEILARAMFAANPTPQLRRIVELFDAAKGITGAV